MNVGDIFKRTADKLVAEDKDIVDMTFFDNAIWNTTANIAEIEDLVKQSENSDLGRVRLNLKHLNVSATIFKNLSTN